MPELPILTALLAGAAAGLVSTPHCAAMCSPIASAACARAGSGNAPLHYQLGRVVGYGFMGLLAGQLGHVLGGVHASETARWALRGLFALSCLWLARHLWRPRAPVDVPLSRLTASSSGSRWTQRLPRILPRQPAALGVLTALLPCGALYAALVLAIGAGTAPQGAWLMVGFAGSSGIALLAATSALQLRVFTPGRSAARAVAGVMVVLACATFAQPLAARTQPQAPSPQTAQCH